MPVCTTRPIRSKKIVRQGALKQWGGSAAAPAAAAEKTEFDAVLTEVGPAKIKSSRRSANAQVTQGIHAAGERFVLAASVVGAVERSVPMGGLPPPYRATVRRFGSPVGTGIAARPPVRSEHARFAHSAPTLGV